MKNKLKLMVSAVEDGQLEKFHRILAEFEDKHAIEDTNILKYICHTPNKAQFLKAYLAAGCSPKKLYDGGYAVHSAAQHLNEENMKILLEFDSTLANQTDSSSMTPLHVVINKTSAENIRAVVEIIKLLILHNADVNFALKPSKADTPFISLVEKLKSVQNNNKRHEILDFIYHNVSYIDINSPKRKEIKQLLLMYHRQLSKRLETNGYDGKSTQQVIGVLLNHLDVCEKKMIQDLYTLQKDPKFRNVVQEVFADGKLLEESIKQGLVLSVKMLIVAGADPFRTFETRHPAIMVACLYGNPSIVKVILDSTTEFDCSAYPEPLLHHTIRKIKEKGFFEPDDDHYKVFDMLINNANIDVNELDKENHSALFYAVRKQDEVLINKLLGKRAFIGSMCDINPTMPFDKIDPKLLEQCFDTCIHPSNKNSNPDDNGYELSIDYTNLKPPAGANIAVNDLTTIDYIASTKKFQHLMTHPLIMSFLFLKWYPLRFYVNLLYYTFMSLLLVAYTLFLDGSQFVHCWLPFVIAMTIWSREIGQIALSYKRYFTSISSYLAIFLTALVWLILVDEPDIDDSSLRRDIGNLVILLAAMELVLLIGSSSTSAYMIMLRKVTITFLKALSLYSILIEDFTCSFIESTVIEEAGFSVQQSPAHEANASMPVCQLTEIDLYRQGDSHMNMNMVRDLDMDMDMDVWLDYTIFIAIIKMISFVMVTFTSRSEVTLIDWIERAKLLTRYKKIRMTNKALTSIFPPLVTPKELRIRINHDADGNVLKPIILPETAKGFGDFLKSHLWWWRRHLNLPEPANGFKSHLWWGRRCFNWCLNKHLSTIDLEIVNQAIGVVEMCEGREQEQAQRKMAEKRMDMIEQMLKKMLRIMEGEWKSGPGQS